MVRPKGVEPLTFWSVVKRSIQLSYERKYTPSAIYKKFISELNNKNGDPLGIRTPDPLIKSQMLYQLS